jgi:hypothetical protein
MQAPGEMCQKLIVLSAGTTGAKLSPPVHTEGCAEHAEPAAAAAPLRG